MMKTAMMVPTTSPRPSRTCMTLRNLPTITTTCNISQATGTCDKRPHQLPRLSVISLCIDP